MRLTKRQRALFEEAEAIANLISLDFHNVEDRDINPTVALQIAIHKMVTGEVVIRCTLLDEILDILEKIPGTPVPLHPVLFRAILHRWWSTSTIV